MSTKKRRMPTRPLSGRATFLLGRGLDMNCPLRYPAHCARRVGDRGAIDGMEKKGFSMTEDMGKTVVMGAEP